ncbi:TIGR03435 family protein [Terriglobus albidus]|uniref:TIGR03435 family protein n=1 Tax=Terriglobus albidus TaxID=1592106 RepID=UPI0021DF5E50|nr:TIGR03435 family protein [Terriglobus albidus]
MMKLTPVLILGASLSFTSAQTQGPPQMAAEAHPIADVATIKMSDPNAHGYGFRLGGGRVQAFNTTLLDMMKWAYGVQTSQIQSLPEWARTQKWDVEATPNLPGMPNKAQAQGMMQLLIVERFHLTTHSEKKALPVYVLERGKGPLKLTKSTIERPVPAIGFTQPGVLVARNATSRELANVLQERLLDRPVVDKVQLSERSDFTLDFQPDASQYDGLWASLPPRQPAKPDLYTAIQEQLGMRLVPSKEEVDVLAVDKVEKPSEN